MNSEEIVTCANLLTHIKRRQAQQELEARRGIENEVKLKTIAEKINGKYVRTTYNWQFSNDGGKTWSMEYVTLGAKVTFTEMPKNNPLLFRKRSFTAKGD